MKRIAVFCGSSLGSTGSFMEQANHLGRRLVQEEIELVYGGAKIGLMGAVADGALAEGGTVIGVLPGFLSSKEIAHDALSELIIVESMHERKTKMHDLSDGFIALPGGFGTLEEFFEILTWGQLGLHNKPMGILNTNGYYDFLLQLLDKMVMNGFLKQVNRDMVLISDNMDELLHQMRTYQSPVVEKWITKDSV